MGFVSDVLGKNTSPPPAPDYTGAAVAQGAANKEAALASLMGSNPNIYGPTGSRSVSYSQGPEGNWIPTIQESYSPEMQALYSKGVQQQTSMADLGNTALGKVGGLLGSPVNFDGAPQAPGAKPIGNLPGLPSIGGNPSNLPSMPGTFQGYNNLPGMPQTYGGAGNLSQMPKTFSGYSNLPSMPGQYDAIRDKVTNAMMSRANTDLGRQWDQKNSDLIAAGIRPEHEAYARERQMQDRARTDAEMQAILAGGQEADRAYQRDLSTRQQGVTEQTNAANLAYSQGMGVRQQGYNEATNDAALRYAQGMGVRQQGVDEQTEAANLGYQQGMGIRQQGYSEGASNLDRAYQQGMGVRGQAFNEQLQGNQQQFGQGMDARRQAITEALALRQTPLQEINAFRTGSQVSPLQFQSYTGANVAPTPVMAGVNAASDYATDVYNAQVGQQNALTSGLFGLGSAYAFGRGARR